MWRLLQADGCAVEEVAVVVHRLEALQIETNKERMASHAAAAAAAAAAAVAIGPTGSVDPSETQPLLGAEAGEGNGSAPVDGSDGSGAPASEGQEEGEQREHEQQQQEEEESEGGTSQQMIRLEAGDGGDGVEAAARSDETEEVSGCWLPGCLAAWLPGVGERMPRMGCCITRDAAPAGGGGDEGCSGGAGAPRQC
eukprot:COSAG01_NODE_171_length_23132_cov_53.865118_24_plen_196_part_00